MPEILTVIVLFLLVLSVLIYAAPFQQLPTIRLLGSQRDFICPITDLWPGITSGLPVIKEESRQ
jgi:hypothetical protein